MAASKKQPKTVSGILQSASRAIYVGRLLRALMIWFITVLGLWLCFFLLDNYFHLPSELRLPVSIAMVLIGGFFLVKKVVLPFFYRCPEDRIALDIENRFQLKDNILINSLQFEARNSLHGKHRLRQFEKPFAETTIAEALVVSRTISPDVLKSVRSVRVLSLSVVLLLAVWVAYGLLNLNFASNALSRFINPLADIPPAGMIDIVVIPDSNIFVAEGDELIVKIKVQPRQSGFQLKKYPEIVWSRDSSYIDNTPPGIKSANSNVRPVNAIDNEPWSYSYTFKNVRHNMAFRIFAADTYSSSVKVIVNKVPRVANAEFLITPPEYTGIKMARANVNNNELALLPGTKVTMNLTLDKSVAGLDFEYQGKIIPFEGSDKDFTLDFLASEPGSFLIKADYRTVGKIVDVYTCDIIPALDSPPFVEFNTDTLSMVAFPGQRINVPVKLADDYGLSRYQLSFEQADSDSEPEIIKSENYDGPPGKKDSSENMLLTLDAHRFIPGNSYIIRALAADFCPNENVSYSKPLVISMRLLDEMTLAPDDPAVGAFELLGKAIDAQKEALGASQNISANLDDIISGSDSEARENLTLHRNSLQGKQDAVGRLLNQAWNISTEPRPDFVYKMDAVSKGEHARVLSKIVVLASQRNPDISMTQRSLESITDLQQYILDKLIALKAAAVLDSEKKSSNETGETKNQLNKSIFETMDESLDNFTTELDNFVTSQKTIIHERTMIMEQAAEDLTADDVDKLASLAIDQSRLSEVLDSAVNDFTSVDLQDFGDMSMVEKMTSIYRAAEELAEMTGSAADDRMARVDAYRLETEAVEMAEEILINCEATLGYYDNVQFIAEIAEDEQLIAPLADLPDELVDIVSDLITSEEEMSQEVEDIGSYLNSLDHTAGPVSDGTISSTSAKGVTGDQKPEDNIIQGRSGAGRSGMSDGQLVESVAKDLHDNEYSLRERISQTPLESGDVRDEDVGAQTGGSGLGKMTDQASLFGQGGNLPPKVLQKMRNAYMQQQAITKSANQLIPRLRRHNLDTSEIELALDNMTTFESQLKQPETGSELKRAYNQTLDSLKKSHHRIGEQIHTRYIQNATGGNSIDFNQQDQTTRYKGYERMINAYFEALAK